MGKLYINVRYREFLQGLGLIAAQDFLHLSGVIICGHPDRNVARIELVSDGIVLRAFLKKEHRVPWRDRLAHSLTGFGLVSKSCKEMILKPILDRAGIDAPEVIAAGEHGCRAFLLLRDVDCATELRRFLLENPNPLMRRQLARRLGARLARMHNAGIVHRDLYAKHVLVSSEIGAEPGFTFCLLDWQRCRIHGDLSWRQRCRDLATLDATLALDLAITRERLHCLNAYRRACRQLNELQRRSFSHLAKRIRAESLVLLNKRHIREQRQPPLPVGQQNLIWLDGEALCVTKEFRAQMQGKLPSWLPRLRSSLPVRNQVVQRIVPLSGGSSGLLIVRHASRPWRWLWSRLRRKPLPSPELQQAADWFRLERHGVRVPRLLAVGQHQRPPWVSRSFLLTEVPEEINLLGAGPASKRSVEIRGTGLDGLEIRPTAHDLEGVLAR